MTSKQKWTPEKDVASAIMSGETMLDTVRRLRKEHLFEGDDFKITKNGVEYSQDGIETLLGLIHVARATEPVPELSIAEPVLNKKTAGMGTQSQAAIVLKVWQGNPHFFLAKLGREEITVCAKETRNFVPGMDIPGDYLKRRGQFSQIHDFVGHCPRGRGKW